MSWLPKCGVKRHACTDNAPATRLQFLSTRILEHAGKLDLSKQAVQLDVEGDSLQLRCAQSANRGDVLLMVPDSLWITTQTVAKSSIGSAVAELAPWLQASTTCCGSCDHAACTWRGYCTTHHHPQHQYCSGASGTVGILMPVASRMDAMNWFDCRWHCF